MIKVLQNYRVKEAYPHIRIAWTKHFYDTVMNIAGPVIKRTKFSESELVLYRDRKWTPRIQNPASNNASTVIANTCVRMYLYVY